MSLDCLRPDCAGRIKGHRPHSGSRELFYEGDSHTCPNCGALYAITVTGDFCDFDDDRLASLVPLPELEALRSLSQRTPGGT